MAVMLICPRCRAGTELRGMVGAWYLTWCESCERIWRIDFRSVLREDVPEPRPSNPCRLTASPP